MQLVTRSHLELLARREGPWACLYVPLHGGGPNARQNRLQFRNAVRAAEDKLRRTVSPEARDAILAHLRGLADTRETYSNDARGLAVLASPERVERWPLPFDPGEHVEVGARPFLEPLVGYATDPVHFYLLVFSLHDVRLFEGSRYVIRQLRLPEGTPERLEDVIGWEIRQDSLQYHSIHSAGLLGGRPAHKGVVGAEHGQGRHTRKTIPLGNEGNRPIYHGQGYGTDDRRTEEQKLALRVAQKLAEVLVHRSSPLVLAAPEPLDAVFREMSLLKNPLTEPMHGNFERTKPETLHGEALRRVEPVFARALERAKARFRDLDGTGRATHQLESTVVAAAQGRVDTLFVRRGAKVVGRYDPDTASVERTSGDRSQGHDLVDWACTDTFLSGGRVLLLPSEEMPCDEALAAILRY